MTLPQVAPLLAGIGIPVVLVVLVFYVLMFPEKAEKVAGWLWSAIAHVFRRADRKAVAFKVQGEINDAQKTLLSNAPEGLIDGKLKIRWNNAENAQAVVGDGDVVVFMKRASHHADNVANALMAYLPKALIPRARRYVDPTTMLAVDLTVAKGLLGVADATPGAIHAFYEAHLDPACSEEDVRERVLEMDEIDIHGWLARVLLPEFQHLGDQMYPGEPTKIGLSDVEEFARWLHRLAARAPGDNTMPLAYKGRFLRVAVVLVANKYKLADHGINPYRKQAKKLLYSGEYDAVYLMARDDNISAVFEIVEALEPDGRIATAYAHEYRLRSDFKKRKLSRERAVIACLRPRPTPEAVLPSDEDLPEVPVEAFDPTGDIEVSRAASSSPEIA